MEKICPIMSQGCISPYEDTKPDLQGIYCRKEKCQLWIPTKSRRNDEQERCGLVKG